MAKISQKLRIKWNFELTVFKLTVPDLYKGFKNGNVSVQPVDSDQCMESGQIINNLHHQ